MPIVIAPSANTLEDWRAVYRGDVIALAAIAHSKIDAGAKAVGDILDRGIPVYGINTGFGKLASVRIKDDDLAKLQLNLILSHSVGVGAPLAPEVVRLITALKVASLSHGASGARLETVRKLVQISKSGLTPFVPAQGSVGASGDLAPLAHYMSSLMGIGEFLVEGRAVPSAPILAEHGIEPLVLSPKEGLALLNGTQVSAALALAGLFEIERAFHASLVAGIMSLEAIKGTDTPFDPRIHALRPHAGQVDVAASLRSLIAGSGIRESHRNCDKVQDPYSFRCMPQVLGASLDAIRHTAGILAIEAQGVSDNPLIFDNGDVLSGGNFHAEPVGFAADHLALAVTEVGSISERRTAILLDSNFSGLPLFLASDPGINSGQMMGQITQAALVSEMKQRATPAVIDTVPTSGNQEDHVSMATHGARRLLDMAANAQAIVAIELMTASHGCDIHAPLRSSKPMEAVRSLIRTRIAPFTIDRRMKPDIDAAIEFVRTGAIKEAAGDELFPRI